MELHSQGRPAWLLLPLPCPGAWATTLTQAWSHTTPCISYPGSSLSPSQSYFLDTPVFHSHGPSPAVAWGRPKNPREEQGSPSPFLSSHPARPKAERGAQRQGRGWTRPRSTQQRRRKGSGRTSDVIPAFNRTQGQGQGQGLQLGQQVSSTSWFPALGSFCREGEEGAEPLPKARPPCLARDLSATKWPHGHLLTALDEHRRSFLLSALGKGEQRPREMGRIIQTAELVSGRFKWNSAMSLCDSTYPKYYHFNT